ncbi:hypothetical protein [Ferruginibacter sp.]|uniref:hypothetical protein n=1 Tax=Ferruginibacter sp. TaxID=1940288 RepID=UPI0019B2F658|nr:hypothetical protein [Ferruginibacter sp.]MBC7629419.1 D-alanine--D-alanine ligase [Ferruginibacter sp.]
MESKKEIDALLPDQYKPLTLFFSFDTKPEIIIDGIRANKLNYPLIIKPDIGMQGKAVVKVNNGYELISAASRFSVDYIIQPFVAFPKEMGIFYVRYPDEEKGKITGIVEKEFLTVTGDGVSTIEQLLNQTPRYILQLPVLRKTLGERMNTILKREEEEVLVPYGNHVRGSLFVDSTYKNNAQLEALIDKVCKSVNGFYYGRLDIRFNSFEELVADKNWSIIELNGAGSEPTHMYDPKHSLFFAWKEIIRHWKMLYEISMQNNKKGYSFLSYSDGKKMLKDNTRLVKKLDEIKFEMPNNHRAPVLKMNSHLNIAR